MKARKPRLYFQPPIQPDQLVQIALSAYYATARACTPAPDDPEPVLWSSPADFSSMLEDDLRRRLGIHLYGPIAPAFPGLRLRVTEANDPGGGRSPPDMGHGWPASAPGQDALASAVGPAPGSSPGVGDAVPVAGCGAAIPADRLFSADPQQELPINVATEEAHSQSGSHSCA